MRKPKLDQKLAEILFLAVSLFDRYYGISPETLPVSVKDIFWSHTN